MANRYWVGGSGTWNASDTTHWSASSGGAGGASVPTSSDSAVFDGLSDGGAGSYVVTHSGTTNCLDLTTGAPSSGNLTLGGSGIINFYGSLYLYTGLVRTFTGNWIALATSGTKTLFFGGSKITANGLSLNGSATYQLLDTLTMVGNSILAIGPSAAFDPNGCGVVVEGSQAAQMQGTWTFYDLTYTGGGATARWLLSADFSVSHVLTVNGTSATARVLVRSNLLGTARKITAATVVVTNADFQDITGAGAASWNLSAITGNSGDCGGNSGITFTSGINLYWQHGASASYNFSDGATRFFLATNGGGGAGRAPLPQDSCFFDANSFAAGSKTVVQDMPRIGAIDWTGVTNTPTFSPTTAASFFGSITLASGMTLTASTATYTYEGRGASTITSAGKSWGKPFVIDCVGGSLTMQDAFSITAQQLTHTSGNFSSNGFSLIALAYSSIGTATRTLNMGASIWTLNSGIGSPWNVAATGFTLNAGTSTISLTGTLTAARAFNGAGLTYYAIECSTSGAFDLQFNGNNIFTSFYIDASSAARSVKFASGSVTSIASLTRNAGTNVITLDTTTGTGTFTLTKTGGGNVILDYMNISRLSWSTGLLYATNSTDGGSNNANVIFATLAPLADSVKSFSIPGGVLPSMQVGVTTSAGSPALALTLPASAYATFQAGVTASLAASAKAGAAPAGAYDSFQAGVLAAVASAVNTLSIPAGHSLAFQVVVPAPYVQPEFPELATNRTVIFEVTPSVTLSAWTLHGSLGDRVYKTPLSAWYNSELYRRVVAVRENFNNLTERADVSALIAAGSGYFWDETNAYLYVKASSGVPSSFTIHAFVTYYFSTEGIAINQIADDPGSAIYYNPWLTGNLPQLTKQISDILFGVTIIASGDVTLINKGYAFSTLSPSHNWKNKQAKLLLAEHGPSLPPERDDFNEIMTMLVEDLAPNEETATFKLIDSNRLLDKEIPPTVYSLNNYPFLGEGVEGQRKWLGYGRATLLPDLTDTSGLGVYTVADSLYQDLFAVHSVTAISKSDGAKTGLAGADYSVDLIACTIEIVNALYTHTDYYIECDVTGKSDGAGSYIKTFAQITKDILSTHLRIPTSSLDASSFIQTDIEAPEELTVWLKEPRSVASIFSSSEEGAPSLERSVLGTIRQTASGLWNVHVIFGAVPSYTVIPLAKKDFVSFLPDAKIESIASIANVFHSYNHADQSWSVQVAEDLVIQYLSETFDTVKLYTFLRSETDAISLVQRALLLASARSVEVEFELRGSALARSMAGDYVSVSYTPAPTLTGSFDNQSLEISRLDLSLSPTLKITGRLGDMRSIADRIGHVTDESAPDWAGSSETERAFNGFVSDENGFIDPLDSITLNKSLVW